MKIRLLKIVASPDFDAAYPGDVIQLPDAQAMALCKAGAAELVEPLEKFKAEEPEELLERVVVEAKSLKKKGRGEKAISIPDAEER